MANTGKNVQAKIVSTSVDTILRSVDLSVDVDQIDSTAANANAKSVLGGAYSWSMDMDLNWGGGSGQAEDTLFRTILSGSQNVQVLPAGGVNASQDNPMYRGNALLKGFSISIPHDGLITQKASFQGDGALHRYTSGSY